MLTYLRPALLALLIAALLAVPPPDRARAQSAIGTCGDPNAPYAEVQIDSLPRIDLRLARTEAERATGLMYVQNMPADNGMLFIYASQSNEGYWMYHTLIPLSIAWIDYDGTIVDIQDMDRLDNPDDPAEAMRKSHPPVASYWYALEVNEGWFVQHGVGIGQQMVFCLGGA